MCHQNCVHLSVEEAIAVEETLLAYCKSVELYNILRSRSLHNPSFLRRCLKYKIQARRKKRSPRAGTVVFNYKDCNNTLRKTEVTEDFSCPFCLMQCASIKGLRHHLTSSHDLFNFEFWVSEDYRAVNVSINIEVLSETLADKAVPQLQTFHFCSRYRRFRPYNTVRIRNEKSADVQFLELDSPRLASQGILKDHMEKDYDSVLHRGKSSSNSPPPSEKDMENGRHGLGNYGSCHTSSMDCIERVVSNSNVLGATMGTAQMSMDNDFGKQPSGSDAPIPSKAKKIIMERSDSKNRMLLQKRQFYHSHRVQPMALEQVLSDWDSEDDVDDDIADLEDGRMLDDFVDVTKYEKQLMHLWNAFVRKQKVLADGHIPWACEAFSKLHGEKMGSSKQLFWCWRLFMIKLWNHGLLDANTMNSCNVILEGFRDNPDAARG